MQGRKIGSFHRVGRPLNVPLLPPKSSNLHYDGYKHHGHFPAPFDHLPHAGCLRGDGLNLVCYAQILHTMASLDCSWCLPFYSVWLGGGFHRLLFMAVRHGTFANPSAVFPAFTFGL
ncbi:1,2-phenylacetyl-CoA epoxidase subunit B [Providencia rustigianii]